MSMYLLFSIIIQLRRERIERTMYVYGKVVSYRYVTIDVIDLDSNCWDS
jgi:hypothetical protein